MSDEWNTDISAAPSGRWLLVRRLERSEDDPKYAAGEQCKPACKIGGKWWQKKDGFLEPLALITGMYYLGPIGAFGHTATDKPDEWCDIPDGIIAQ